MLSTYPYVQPQDVKDELFGVALVSKDKRPLADDIITKRIEYAVSEVERRLDIFLRPRKVAARHVAPDAALGFDIYEPPYDYDPERFREWGYMRLRHYPVLTVEAVRIVTPALNNVLELTQWVQLNPEMGEIRIVPGTAAFSGPAMTVSGLFQPFGRGVPQTIEVDYTAGMTEKSVADEHVLTDVITKMAAYEVLSRVAQSQGFGAANVSAGIDGLSKSFGFGQSGPYGERLQGLLTHLQEFFKDAKTYYKGFLLA